MRIVFINENPDSVRRSFLAKMTDSEWRTLCVLAGKEFSPDTEISESDFEKIKSMMLSLRHLSDVCSSLLGDVK